MKNIFKNTETILDAEKILAEYFPSNSTKANYLSELPATEDDIRFLLSEFKNLNLTLIPLEYCYELRLSILVVWTFSLIFEYTDSSIRTQFLSIIKALSQHHLRYYAETVASAFDDYALESYGHNFNKIEGLTNTIEMHVSHLDNQKSA